MSSPRISPSLLASPTTSLARSVSLALVMWTLPRGRCLGLLAAVAAQRIAGDGCVVAAHTHRPSLEAARWLNLDSSSQRALGSCSLLQLLRCTADTTTPGEGEVVEPGGVGGTPGAELNDAEEAKEAEVGAAAAGEKEGSTCATSDGANQPAPKMTRKLCQVEVLKNCPRHPKPATLRARAHAGRTLFA